MAESKIKEVVDKVVEKVSGFVDAELVEVKGGIHTIFSSKGVVEFVDGKSKLLEEVAKELKELGLIK